MPGGKGNIKPEDGKQFSSTNQPKNRGRKPSIRKQLEKYLGEDGSFTLPMSQIIEVVETTEEQEGYIRIAIPRQEALAQKLLSIAMGGDIQAIKMIMEQIDGRPSQRFELDMPDTGQKALPLEEYSDSEVLEEFDRLHDIMRIGND